MAQHSPSTGGLAKRDCRTVYIDIDNVLYIYIDIYYCFYKSLNINML